MREIIAWILTGILFIGIPVAVVVPVPLNILKIIQYVIASAMIFIVTYQIVEYLSTFFVRDREYISLNSDIDSESPRIQSNGVTILIVAYLPNEKGIIMEILEYYRTSIIEPYYLKNPPSIDGGSENNALPKLNVILGYNSPEILPVEARLIEYSIANKWFTPIRVEGSRSKAENINWVLEHCINITHPVLGVYDTDHNPREDSVRRAEHWLYAEEYDFVQGRSVIRPVTESVLELLVRFDFDMMYTLFHKARFVMSGIALFGGSNGYWKTSVLREIRFDPRMLTEDIDCSVRAVLAGYRGRFDKLLVSTEEAPPTVDALWKQRVRWSQGWSEVSLSHVIEGVFTGRLPFHQKIHMFFLLFFREVFVYFQIFGFPLLVSMSIKSGTFSIDYFTISVLVYSLVYYPILALCVFFAAEFGDWHAEISKIFLAVLFNVFFKSIWDPVLCIHGHVRCLLRLNKWNITPRSS